MSNIELVLSCKMGSGCWGQKSRTLRQKGRSIQNPERGGEFGGGILLEISEILKDDPIIHLDEFSDWWGRR